MDVNAKNLPEETHRESTVAAELARRRRMQESRPELERFVASLPRMSSSVDLIREDRDEH